MIQVRGLRKVYKTVTAVDDLSFTVHKGEILGLVGPNGAGKTTTLKCLCGVALPTQGLILIDNINMARDEQEAKKMLAFVPETPNPYEILTVYEHMKFISLLYNVPNPDPYIDDLLKKFELYHKRNDLVNSLSKGMKQKLTISCALVHDPKILLLDEPLIGIDPRGARTLKDILIERAETGDCVIISSHMLYLVEELCHRIIILDEGKKIAEGSLKDIRKKALAASDASLEEVFLKITEEPP
ncbi:MAG: ABC transporter ATP-binding protein [Candidatus Methanofastidiosia archaeon]|jgi:ABC-2 type transport system ATP-binding protein